MGVRCEVDCYECEVRGGYWWSVGFGGVYVGYCGGYPLWSPSGVLIFIHACPACVLRLKSAVSPDFHSWLNMCMKECILIIVRDDSLQEYHWVSLCVLMVAIVLLCVW